MLKLETSKMVVQWEGRNIKRSRNQATSASHSQHSASWHTRNKSPNIFRLPELNSLDFLSITKDYTVCGKGTLDGWSLILSQIYGLVIKKILYSIRGYHVVLQIIVPLWIMLMGLMLMKTEAHDIRKFSLTSRPLRGVTVVSTVVGPEGSVASKLEKLYQETVQLSGGKPLSLLPVQLAGLLKTLIIKKTVSRKQDILIGAIFTAEGSNNLSTSVNITALYNAQADHCKDMSVATVMKVVHNYCMNLDDTNVTDERHIDFAIQSLPLAGEYVERHVYITTRHFCIHSSVIVLLSMAFLTSTFAVFLVKERKTGSRHLQRLSGADPLIYYIGTLIADMLVYILACAVIFISPLFLNSMLFMYQKLGITLMFVMVSYGLTSFPLVYSLQFLFIRLKLCVLVLFSVRITFGALILLLSYDNKRLNLFDSSWPSGQQMSPLLNMFSPSYSLFVAFYRMCMDFEYRRNCFNKDSTCENNWQYQCCLDSQAVKMVFELLLSLICWSAIFILLDSYFLRRYLRGLKKQQLETVLKRGDSNIQTEDKRVSGKSSKDVIVLKNIVKRYGKKIIINNISVAVSKGECLCFLGREKSGKSTLLNIITGQTIPTSGKVLIGTQETIASTVKAHIRMSYCPQKIALLDELTGRDTLLLFGRLRGVHNTLLKVATHSLINKFRILNPDKKCKGYSSTDRKKLSIAVSLIGEPQIVILDEPTFGLDYTDKKTVWRLLSCIQQDHRAVIVATSSAEECEIVCGNNSNITILSEGKLSCLAPPPVLMENYGSGYTVIVRFRTDEDGNIHSQMPFLNSVVEVFTDVEIISDKDICRLHFSNDMLNLGKVFALLEDGISYYHVADYSVQKTSLPHIFYSLSVCPEEEYIEIPPGASSSFDIWPPHTSVQQQFETCVD